MVSKKTSDSLLLLSYLDEKYEQWLLTKDKKRRNWIEDCVMQFINYNMDDSIYLEANDGRATGLCAYPNFERDLKKIINVLKKRL